MMMMMMGAVSLASDHHCWLPQLCRLWTALLISYRCHHRTITATDYDYDDDDANDDDDGIGSGCFRVLGGVESMSDQQQLPFDLKLLQRY